MDGLHKFDLALMAATSSPARQLVAAVSGGASVLFIGQVGVAEYLSAVRPMLGAARTRVLHVRPPLELTDFMEQVASAFPVTGQCALERGFESLTVLDEGCDRIALLVEDAHLLPHPTLRYIEMALRAGPHLQVVLAGQPALTETLDLAGFTSLRQRFSVRVDVEEPLPEPSPAVVVPIANARRSRRPAMLAGALAASVALVAWSIHSSIVPPVPPAVVTVEAVAAPSTDPSSPAVAETLAIGPSTPDTAPVPEPAAPITVAQEPEAEPPAPTEALAAPSTDPSSPAVAETLAIGPSTPDTVPALEPAASITVALQPEAEPPAPTEALAAVPEVTPGPALTAEAPLSVPTPDPAPSPEPAAPVVATLAPETLVPVPAEVQAPVVSTIPDLPLPPVVAMLPAAPQSPPPQARSPIAASPVLPRQIALRPAPVRSERAASVVPASAQNQRRCRDIVLRVQLGEAPDDGDRMFLRNGCR